MYAIRSYYAKKYFFMPGFTSTSGGLIQDRQLSDEEKKIKRKYFEDRFGFESGRMLISIFTYEHDFTGFFTDLKNFGKKTNIIVFGRITSYNVCYTKLLRGAGCLRRR